MAYKHYSEMEHRYQKRDAFSKETATCDLQKGLDRMLFEGSDNGAMEGQQGGWAFNWNLQSSANPRIQSQTRALRNLKSRG